MREYFFTPEAGQDLSDFNLTKSQFARLNIQVTLLAENPDLGFRIPFQLLDFPEPRYRFVVGDFKLNYTYNDKELWIVSVMV